MGYLCRSGWGLPRCRGTGRLSIRLVRRGRRNCLGRWSWKCCEPDLTRKAGLMGLSWLWGCLIFCEPAKLQGLSYSMYRLGWLDTSRWGYIGLSGRGHSLGGRCWPYRSLFVSVRRRRGFRLSCALSFLSLWWSEEATGSWGWCFVYWAWVFCFRHTTSIGTCILRYLMALHMYIHTPPAFASWGQLLVHS